MRRVASTALLGLVLVLVVGAPSASAATSSTLAVIRPGTASATGSPMVPASVLTSTVPNGSAGMVNNAYPGLMFSATSPQSIQDAGYAALTAQQQNAGGSSTATNPACGVTFTLGGSWGVYAPLTMTTTPVGRNFTQANCNSTAASAVSHACWDSSTNGFSAAGPSLTVTGFSGTGCVSPRVTVAASVLPTTAVNAALTYDGQYWVNPAYAALLASSTVISTTRTCQNTSTGALTTVQADGLPGTGVAPPGAACAAGTVQTCSRTWSHLPGGPFPRDLVNTCLATNALTNYANCVGAGSAGCDLAVLIDGVKCILTGVGCRDWLNSPPPGSTVTCKWGGYLMPNSDCAPLQNCYQVPLDSIGSTDSACAVDPGDGPGVAPKPVQGGHTVQPQPTAPSASATMQPSGSAGTGTGGTAPSASGSMQPGGGTGTATATAPGGGTTTIVVQVPAEGPVSVPADSEANCFDASTSIDFGGSGGASGRAGILAVASAEGVTANPHTSPEGYPSFDLMSEGAQRDRIAETMRANHAKFGLHYVISNMKITSAKSAWNWRDYTPITSSGDFRHEHHVHVSYGLEANASVTWNPVDIAYKPVHCALTKALGPPEAGHAQAVGDGITAGLGAPLRPWTDAVGNIAGAFSVGGAPSCGGPALRFHVGPVDRTFYPASTCSEPAATLALICRVGTGGLLIVTGLWSCVRLLASGLGYNGVASGGE